MSNKDSTNCPQPGHTFLRPMLNSSLTYYWRPRAKNIIKSSIILLFLWFFRKNKKSAILLFCGFLVFADCSTWNIFQILSIGKSAPPNANHYHLHLEYFRHKKTQILIRVFWHDYCLIDFDDNKKLNQNHNARGNSSYYFKFHFKAEKFRLFFRY